MFKINDQIIQPRYILIEPKFGEWMALLSQHQISIMKIPLNLNFNENTWIESR